MNRNQKRAVTIARAIEVEGAESTSISESDWNLLLLAAEMNDIRAHPRILSHRVLERALRRLGYFADDDPCAVSTLADQTSQTKGDQSHGGAGAMRDCINRREIASEDAHGSRDIPAADAEYLRSLSKA